VIGVPLSVGSDQATLIVSLSTVVVIVVGIAEMKAHKRLRVLEGSEYPYSFFASILNS
jgi:spore maturation protein SpmA